jgi:cytochrome P450
VHDTSLLPPGPSRSTAWQLLRYSFEPLAFIDECAREFGAPFTIRLRGFAPLVLLSDAESVKDVLRGDPVALHSGEGNDFLSVTVGKSSVMVLDEEPHQRQRRILMPPMRGERMRAHLEAMREATLESIESWPIGRSMRMDEPMRAITLRVMLEVVFGRISAEERAGWERRFERIVAYGRTRLALLLLQIAPARRFPGSRWLPFYREMHALDSRLFALIERRRGEGAMAHGECILADLLAATHEDGSRLEPREIRDAIMTVITAGYETTSIALTWALEQIVPRDDVVAQIRAEVGDFARAAGPLSELLESQPYLDAAIRESLRVRTILPFVVRLTKRPFEAGGREYPAGVLLCPCNHLVHASADIYARPELFLPERFLERKYAAHEWFPFGGGNRACLGMAFALHEMKVVLATLLSSVDLERSPGARSRPRRQGITLAPHDGAAMLAARSRAIPESLAGLAVNRRLPG